MTEIDARIGEIDKQFAQDFPDYAALAIPKPMSVERRSGQRLPTDEALVLLLDTPERPPTPEETFIWVVTKTDVPWVRSELGTQVAQSARSRHCGAGSITTAVGAHRIRAVRSCSRSPIPRPIMDTT